MIRINQFKADLRKVLMETGQWILPTKIVRDKKNYTRKSKHKNFKNDDQ